MAVTILVFTFLSPGLLKAAFDNNTEFTIGMEKRYSSLDPQAESTGVNIAIASHFYDALYLQGSEGESVPHLVENHQQTDELTWEFTLKQDVRFHDGQELDASDVIYTLDRLFKLYPRDNFAEFLGDINYKKLDRYRFSITTDRPRYDLLIQLQYIYIMSRVDGTQQFAEDFTRGKAVNGTGPYRFSSEDDQSLLMAINPDYHGQAAYLNQVRIRHFTSRQALIAAFLADEVDMVERLTPVEINSLEGKKSYRLTELPGHRIMHLFLDSSREQSPFVTDLSGQPLDSNPLRLAAVRKAMALAIDRQWLVGNVLYHAAKPTTQLVHNNLPGYLPGARVTPPDIESAKQLLSEAGYPQGFRLTLHGPNNRYPEDERVIEAIAIMWQKIGIQAEAVDMPKRDYFPGLREKQFSSGLLGYHTFGRIMDLLTDLIASRESGFGASNSGGYVNREVDALILKGLRAGSGTVRQRSFRQAVERALDDQAIIPLYFIVEKWATRSDMAYWPRHDFYTEAAFIRPVQ